MLDGRVKTLHPTIHGGLLARRDGAAHMAALEQHGIAPIDLLVVNLYPFEATVAQADCTLEEAIENIDIGGPAMVRAAAKNWRDVAVLTDPAQYARVLAELKARGRVSSRHEVRACRGGLHPHRRLRRRDRQLPVVARRPERRRARARRVPGPVNGRFVKLQDLRYGENPHQSAAFYRDLQPAPGSLVTARQLQGKELSYNNIADADAAWECVKTFGADDAPAACVIVKHANPCGVALGESAAEAYAKALKTDPDLRLRRHHGLQPPVDRRGAERRGQAVRRGADRAGVQRRGAARCSPASPTRACCRSSCRRRRRGPQHATTSSGSAPACCSRPPTTASRAAHELRVVTTRQPTPQQLDDLLFAWKVAKYVKSNAIVFCAGGMTLGVGAGQMSRVDSARIARSRPNGGAVAGRLGGGERRVLPVPRWPRRGGRRRRGLRDPARRLDARRRGDRGRRRARRRDGVHRRAAFPALRGVAASRPAATIAVHETRPRPPVLLLSFLARLITGAQGHWYGCPPKAEQFSIYFANHQSHFDWVLIWAALPSDLRCVTRPIAARRLLDLQPAQALDHPRDLQRRLRDPPSNRTDDEDPLEPLAQALHNGDSLVIFPGHARQQGRSAAVQGRPVPPCRAVPAGPAHSGVDRQRAARDAQGRGRPGAHPVLGHLRRAARSCCRAGTSASSSIARARPWWRLRERALMGVRCATSASPSRSGCCSSHCSAC